MRIRSAKSRAAVFSSGQAIAGILNLLVNVFVARILGPYLTGVWNFLLWIATVAVAVAALNMQNAATYYVSKFRSQGDIAKAAGVAAALFRVALLSSTLTASAVFLVLLVTNNSADVGSAAFLVIAVVFWTIGNVLAGVLVGEDKYGATFAFHVVPAVSSLLGTLIVLVNDQGIFGLALNLLVTNVLALVIGWSATRGSFAAPQPLGPSERSSVRGYVATTSAIIVLNLVVWDRSEVLFLNLYWDPLQVAYYTVSFSLIASVMRVFPGAVAVILLPRIAAMPRSSFADRENLREVFNIAVAATTVVAFLIAVPGLFLAPLFIRVLYGAEYEPMITTFRILLFSGVVAILANTCITALLALERQRIVLYFVASVALLNVALDLVLIPAGASDGAALANGATQAVGVVLLFRLLAAKESLRLRPQLIACLLIPVGVALAVGFLASYLLSSNGRFITIAVTTLASTGVLISLLLLFRVHRLLLGARQKGMTT